MFFDIEHNLCQTYQGLTPLSILDYPAEDVFELINNVLDYSSRNAGENHQIETKVRRPAGDSWF